LRFFPSSALLQAVPMNPICGKATAPAIPANPLDMKFLRFIQVFVLVMIHSLFVFLMLWAPSSPYMLYNERTYKESNTLNGKISNIRGNMSLSHFISPISRLISLVQISFSIRLPGKHDINKVYICHLLRTEKKSN